MVQILCRCGAGRNRPCEIAVCAHAILSDDVLVVPDALDDARFRDNPQVTGVPFIRFYAGAPLVTTDGFRLGTFCIVDTVPRTFSPSQAANLQHFAAMVMETLEARRTTALMATALESTSSGVVICDPNKPELPIVFANLQVEALAQARQSEARLALAQQVAQIGSWECTFTASGDVDQKSVIWSEETYRLVGLARAEGADVWEHFYRCLHPDDIAAVNAAFGEAIRTRQHYSIDHRMVLPDGTLRILHEEASILLDEATGKPMRIIGTMQDVTERKAAEDALRISEQNHRAFFDANPLPSWVFDLHTLAFLEVNPAAVAHYGYSREEFLAMTLRDIRPPEGIPTLLAKLPVPGAGPVRLSHLWHRKKDGTLIEVEISGSEVSFAGRPARLTVAHDVTERRRTELALRESEGRFSGAFTHSPIGTALVSPEGRWLQVNPALCQMIGYSEAELLARSFQDITHPEDLEIGQERLRQMARNEPLALPFEKRYIRADGQVINVLVSSTVVRDEAGRPKHWVSQVQDISERKRAEEELRWKTAFLEAQVNSSFDAIIVVGSQGKLLLQNQRCIDLWQVPAHLTGTSVFNNEERLKWVAGMTTDPSGFIEKLNYLRTHPDDTLHDEVLLKSGTVLDRYSAPVLGQNGTYYGRIWTYRDITERKQIEESLRESEARYAQIAANMPGMVYRFVLRSDGGFAAPYVSHGCLELYGVEPEEMQRNVLVAFEAVHADDREGHRQSIAASAATLEPWNWQGRILRRGTGEVRYIQGAAKPTRKNNGDIVWDGLILDVTARKQAEENLRAKEEAERTNKEKSKFLSRMSHELRTPLNAILGFGQVLEFSSLNEQDALALNYILKGGRHLLSLIDEVLDLSRVECGELRLELSKVDAADVAQECVDLMERLTEAQNIRCTVESPRGHPILWCDELRLRQMLLNLLSNAIKYNRKGGKITVGFEPVSGHRLRLNVTDTGCGISPEGIAKLFVPFERLQHEDGDVEGTGLGLVVSRRIAEAMDGTIDVISEVGRGSTFSIELPMAVAPTVLSTDTAGSSGDRFTKPAIPDKATLLYIEDNLSNLQVVQMLLSRQRPQWQFSSARAGRQGLEQARLTLPEAILLDLQLPGMSGEEVLEQLRLDATTRHIPVIVLTADATTHSREHLSALGANEFVSKPFQVQPFLALLDRVLRRATKTMASARKRSHIHKAKALR